MGTMQTTRLRFASLLVVAIAILGGATQALAEEITSMEGFQSMPLVYPKFMIDNLWILIAAALVFIMHLGFATLETGLTRQKNTVNILFKNVFIVSVGIITYALTGFNTMYPGDFNGYLAILGPIGFGIVLNAHGGPDYTLLAPMRKPSPSIAARLVLTGIRARCLLPDAAAPAAL